MTVDIHHATTATVERGTDKKLVWLVRGCDCGGGDATAVIKCAGLYTVQEARQVQG
jgi:hypothetical protein